MNRATPVSPEPGRALWLSTVAFTICFAVWTIFSIIGIGIKQELGLNETEFGLLVGTPILSGSLIRLILGVWTDQYGGRRVYTAVMLAAAVATYFLTWAHTYTEYLIAAFFVGIAGGSFAVGVAYVSDSTPPVNRARHPASSAPAMSDPPSRNLSLPS
jgi:MFS transporter, NNP family, nitrate/nitrite transporter